jgi:(p)ppGpp synthase/HD superfamily hydrolase
MAKKTAIDKAKELAADAHADQKHGTRPYIMHLWEVADTVKKYSYLVPESEHESLIVAAFLHDIVEDTSVTIEEIIGQFGSHVGTLVELVTNKPGVNRAARHEATYHLIAGNQGATFLKLCDRIANVSHTIAVSDKKFFKMYSKEHNAFKAIMHKPGIFEDMWRDLDALMDYYGT